MKQILLTFTLMLSIGSPALADAKLCSLMKKDGFNCKCGLKILNADLNAKEMEAFKLFLNADKKPFKRKMERMSHSRQQRMVRKLNKATWKMRQDCR